MNKHIIVSEDTHNKFKSLAQKKGMKFDGLLNEVLDQNHYKETGFRDLSRVAFTPPRSRPVIGDNEMFYEIVGYRTSWNIDCDCCGASIDNSTEIDIYTGKNKDKVRINSCHYCSNTHVIPTLRYTEVGNNIKPQQFLEYILNKYDEKGSE